MIHTAQPRECVVDTRYGALRGLRSNGVRRFLGIPYAAPPVGERRFAAPHEPEPWSTLRDATVPGCNSPQFVRGFPGIDVTALVGRGWQRGDDYLTLNVWAPENPPGKCPVLVFIHGGAFVCGSSDAPVHDGCEFARSGVVYVAINYRLGAEGFLAIPGVPTNLGLRDQLAALGWVKANIDAFGGDPARMTVAGESAGGMSVANLLASPLARGLFRRAIVQSGHGSMVRARETAGRVARLVAAQLGVSADLAGFRQRSLEECAAAVETVSGPEVSLDLRDPDGTNPAYGLSKFLPVWGDDVLPRPPLEALAAGAGSEVELLIGTNREEMNLYLVSTGVRDNIDRLVAERLLGAFHPKAAETLALYGKPGAIPGIALAAAMTDLVFRWPARQFAAAHRGRAHLYEFGWRSPACGGELGACHALELPFVFNTLPTCTGTTGIAGLDPPRALAQRTHRIWADFVIDGHLPWAPYEDATRQCMSLESGSAARDAEIPVAAL